MDGVVDREAREAQAGPVRMAEGITLHRQRMAMITRRPRQVAKITTTNLHRHQVAKITTTNLHLRRVNKNMTTLHRLRKAPKWAGTREVEVAEQAEEPVIFMRPTPKRPGFLSW